MDNVIRDVTDEMGELVRDTGKRFVRDVVKGIPQAAKKQLGSDVSNNSDKSDTSNTEDVRKQQKGGKVDPVTGKPVASKRVLSDLQKATAQVAQVKLKQIREELEKQRLKTTQTSQKTQTSQTGQGPEIPVKPQKPKEDVIAKTLKQSKSTGEFGKNIGG